MDSITETRLAAVHPELARRIRQLDQQLDPQGIVIRVTQGLRTWAQQDELYAQGRTAPGAIVTNAPGGESAHNFGYAVDAVPNDPAFPAWAPDWNSRDARWTTFLENATGCGLAEGAQWRSFPDAPHLYLQELPANPDDEMRAILREAGMQALWEDWVTRYSIAL